MARDDENKREFSSTSRMLKEAIKTIKSGSIIETNSKNQLPDEVKPLWSLSPDSPEFKRRINEENFKYFMELNYIYLIKILLTKQSQQEIRNKNELLTKYSHHLEEIKQFFQNLASGKSGTEKLDVEQIKRLELLSKRLDEGITIITKQIEQIDLLIKKINEDIKKLMQDKQNHKIEYSNVIRSYFSDDVVIKNADRILIPLEYREKEISKSTKLPVNLILNETHIKTIMQDISAKIIKDEFSFTSQANEIQKVVREHLHDEVKKLASFLAAQEKEALAKQFMSSHEGARGIDTISIIISEHIEEKEALNQHKLQVIQENIAKTDSDLHDALEKNEFLETFREAFVEKVEVFMEANNNINLIAEEEISSKAVLEKLDAFQDDFDDLFSDDEPTNKMLETLTQEIIPEEETATHQFTLK